MIVNFQTSQGSVATQLRQDGNLYHRSTETFFGNMLVKRIFKIGVHIYQSCDQNSSVFETQCTS